MFIIVAKSDSNNMDSAILLNVERFLKLNLYRYVNRPWCEQALTELKSSLFIWHELFRLSTKWVYCVQHWESPTKRAFISLNPPAAVSFSARYNHTPNFNRENRACYCSCKTSVCFPTGRVCFRFNFPIENIDLIMEHWHCISIEKDILPRF